MSDSKRLLFVDDDDSIRATLPLILQGYGFDVRSAANVPEALDKIRNYNFDALLSDLNIDGPQDGYTVVRAMRQANPSCVAIILTANPGLLSTMEGIGHDIDEYFIKPADINSLVAAVTARLARHRAA
jgi:DNA-binding response OmpR family regulator